jgi:hypothetical protein
MTMMGRRIQVRQLTQIIALVALGIFWGFSNEASAANEQRCNDLGANCICSEPLNTSTYTQDVNAYFNPADTTVSDKQCLRANGFPGTVLEDGAGFRYAIDTSGVMFTALPNKSPTITRLLRTQEGGGGQFMGENFPAGAPSARRAFRFYMYYSSNYQLTSGGCLNSAKILEVGHDPSLLVTMSGNGNYEIYGWTGWNLGTFDCCIQGPQDSALWGTYTEGNIRGKWFRFEVVATNTLTSSPNPTVIKVYMKNVTDNTPEVTVIDTSLPTAQPNGQSWTTTQATGLRPSAADIDQLWIDSFRNGSCAGYLGFSHLLAAAWSTDAGQRIGAAVEIEGGGNIAPPAPPANLRISMLMEEGQ